MTTTTASPVLANGLDSLAFSRNFLDSLLDGFPEDQLLHQPVPGANHVLWNAGHIANTDSFLMQAVGQCESTCPASWNDLFGMGSEPSTDASIYPSFAEVREAMVTCRTALREWFSGMSDEQLASPLPEDFKGFAPNYGTFISNMAAHESMHVGQIAMIRKALGLPRAMG